jgi:hypothetical protein
MPSFSRMSSSPEWPARIFLKPWASQFGVASAVVESKMSSKVTPLSMIASTSASLAWPSSTQSRVAAPPSSAETWFQRAA